jgi:hypothetical protein
MMEDKMTCQEEIQNRQIGVADTMKFTKKGQKTRL